ncbi:MAG: HAD family hydrolase [Anaerolineae bacterium]|nr:MAG: HAD family hydrolase [Anaerolineae bacterium]
MVEAEFFRYRNWAVFLDRDGTLNREVNYLGDPEQLELLPGVPEGLRALREAGARLVVVTNQAGVARGYYSERDVHRVHAALREKLSAHGAEVDEVYYCPHHPTAGRGHYKKDCPNRKPSPGMLLQAQRDFNLDLTRSFIVGDKLSDLLAGHQVGCRTVLVLTGYGEQTRASLDEHGFSPDFVARDLQEAAEWIVANRPIPLEAAHEQSVAHPVPVADVQD